MSLLGRIVARVYGTTLPAFASLEEANSVLTRSKDEALRLFLAEHSARLALDFSFESLKRVELWFLKAGSPEKGAGGYSTAHAIGYYFGEVLRSSAGFEWTVQEYAFEPGKYELGVNRGLVTIMLARGWSFPAAGNKKMQSLWREARKYAI